jgi:hypothetical protein
MKVKFIYLASSLSLKITPKGESGERSDPFYVQEFDLTSHF